MAVSRFIHSEVKGKPMFFWGEKGSHHKTLDFNKGYECVMVSELLRYSYVRGHIS